jgi:cell division inhibitor SepF
MSGFWKKSLVYFGVMEDVEEFGPLPNDRVEPTTVRTIPTTAPSVRLIHMGPDDPEPFGFSRTVDLCVMEPHEFAEARAIGDRLKDHAPIVINLRHADRDVAKRLVDFACGLSYMSGGQVKKIAGRILLLTPPDVDLSVAEARELISRR